MKIAFASADGKTVNQRFAQTARFQIWEVEPDRATDLGPISAITSSARRDDRHAAQASAVAHCSIVCSTDINIRASAKVVARNVFHLKTLPESSIVEVVEQIQQVLRGNPPPWMKKIMGTHPVHLA